MTAQPLFARIMGADFDRLAPVLRRLHAATGVVIATGRAEVVRGTNPVARLAALLFRFPSAGSHALRMTFIVDQHRERWTRDFSGDRFASELSQSGRQLVERFGAFRFMFNLVVEDAALALRMTGWSAIGVPLPMVLAPCSTAREWQDDDRFCFDIALALPMFGDIVRYSGWLRPEA